MLFRSNDLDLLRRTGVGRDINRHYYSPAELAQALTRPVVRSLLSLLRLRNTHRAFQGTCRVAAPATDRLTLEWRGAETWARLDVDLARTSATVTCSGPGSAAGGDPVWRSSPEEGP